ncbi:MAG: alpha/beta hydrolase [Thermoleophilaceae bacterium]|nr:alpha/beta hydrolase [Thermoleophilaceae bacterium]
MSTVLFIPGLGGSPPGHWQSLWEGRDRDYRRVEQRDWEAPDKDEWVAALAEAVAGCKERPLLVAHSLGCAVVAHWGGVASGALLVSPADVDDEAHTPPETRSFAPMPMKPLGYPAIVVASKDDPFVTEERARAMAEAWDARFRSAGNSGHINLDSGHGPWPTGESVFADLRSRAT